MKKRTNKIGLFLLGMVVSASAAPQYLMSNYLPLDTRDDEHPEWVFSPENYIVDTRSPFSSSYAESLAVSVDTTYAFVETREFSGADVCFFALVPDHGDAEGGATEWVDAMEETATSLGASALRDFILEKGLHVVSRLLGFVVDIILEMPTVGGGTYWKCSSFVALNETMHPISYLELPVGNTEQVSPILYFSEWTDMDPAGPPRTLTVTHTVGGSSYPYATYELLTEQEAADEIWDNYMGRLITIMPKDMILCGSEGEYALSYGGSIVVFANAPQVGSFDADGDGLPDGWELDSFSGENCDGALNADNDKYSNAEEYVLGTSPTDPASTFNLNMCMPLSTGTVSSAITLSFDTKVGRNYTIETSHELSPNDWNVKTNFIGTGGDFEFVDDATDSNQFYRVEVELQ